jgi:Ca-activated chloride channel family protein
MRPDFDRRPLFGGLAIVAAITGLNCSGAASGAGEIPSFSGGAGASTASGSGSRGLWSPGGPAAGKTDTSGGGAPAQATAGPATGSTGAGGTGAVNSPQAALCPNVPNLPAGDHQVTLSVSRSRATVSPVQARGVLLGSGGATRTLPAADGLSVDEFLNYFGISYGKVTDVSVGAGLEPGPFPADQLLLQVGVQAPAAAARPPAVITAVVDTSLPMAGDGITRAREALTAIVASLQANDHLTIVTSGGSTKDLTVGMPSDPAVLQQIAALAVDGGNDFGGAVVDAYESATTRFLANGANRVVLITAGGVPYSSVDFSLIAKKADDPGIGVVGVGVGAAIAYDDKLLASATEAGRGYDLYLDRTGEAEVMLHHRFDEVMGVAARNVTVNVTLPFFLDYTAPAMPPPPGAMPTGAQAETDLSPGRALVYRGVLKACTATTLQYPGATTNMITVDVAYTPFGSTQEVHAPMVQATIAQLMQQNGLQIAKADAISAFVDALKAGDALRWQKAYTLATATTFANDSDFTDPNVGILALLAQAKPLLH